MIGAEQDAEGQADDGGDDKADRNSPERDRDVAPEISIIGNAIERVPYS